MWSQKKSPAPKGYFPGNPFSREEFTGADRSFIRAGHSMRIHLTSRKQRCPSVYFKKNAKKKIFAC
jgi:hypothetical protein